MTCGEKALRLPPSVSPPYSHPSPCVSPPCDLQEAVVVWRQLNNSQSDHQRISQKFNLASSTGAGFSHAAVWGYVWGAQLGVKRGVVGWKGDPHSFFSSTPK